VETLSLEGRDPGRKLPRTKKTTGGGKKKKNRPSLGVGRELKAKELGGGD